MEGNRAAVQGRSTEVIDPLSQRIVQENKALKLKTRTEASRSKQLSTHFDFDEGFTDFFSLLKPEISTKEFQSADGVSGKAILISHESAPFVFKGAKLDRNRTLSGWFKMDSESIKVVGSLFDYVSVGDDSVDALTSCFQIAYSKIKRSLQIFHSVHSGPKNRAGNGCKLVADVPMEWELERWYFIALVVGENSATLFLNDLALKSFPIEGSAPAGNETYTSIGGALINGSASRVTRLLVDDIRIYDRALGRDEVRAEIEGFQGDMFNELLKEALRKNDRLLIRTAYNFASTIAQRDSLEELILKNIKNKVIAIKGTLEGTGRFNSSDVDALIARKIEASVTSRVLVEANFNGKIIRPMHSYSVRLIATILVTGRISGTKNCGFFFTNKCDVDEAATRSYSAPILVTLSPENGAKGRGSAEIEWKPITGGTGALSGFTWGGGETVFQSTDIQLKIEVDDLNRIATQ